MRERLVFLQTVALFVLASAGLAVLISLAANAAINRWLQEVVR